MRLALMLVNCSFQELAMSVRAVQIDVEACIACEQCVNECDQVFEMVEDKAIVKPEAQSPEVLASCSEGIQNAADACPSEAIKLEAA
jgi:ferredoxin